MENEEYCFDIVPGSYYGSSYYKIDGYLFKLDTSKRLRSGFLVKYYKCKDKCCPARLCLYDEKPRLNGKEHNHEANLYEPLKNEMMAEIKRKARNSTANLREIFDAVSIQEK